MAQDLIAGRLPVEDDSMILDVVLHHGRHWSLNNRHLHALKLFLHEVQPECLRSRIMARVRVWPLVVTYEPRLPIVRVQDVLHALLLGMDLHILSVPPVRVRGGVVGRDAR